MHALASEYMYGAVNNFRPDLYWSYGITMSIIYQPLMSFLVPEEPTRKIPKRTNNVLCINTTQKIAGKKTKHKLEVRKKR